ncbi:MAG: carboxypeptidase-like regulatory domain-containing protein [Kiritimatiellia bacterium]
MKREKLVMALVFCAFMSSSCGYAELNNDERKAYKKGAYLRTTFKILDTDGKPVAGAYIQAGYSSPRKDGNWSKGHTNTNGLYTATGHTSDRMTYTVTKDGYYESGGEYFPFRKASPQVTGDKWQPWNPTLTVVLKQKKNPIRMYAKIVSAEVPVLGKPVGYDLVKGDWVKPHGDGEHSDFIFTVDGTYVSPLDRQALLSLTFSNEHDGIQEFRQTKESGRVGQSELISPYLAPADGYQAKWSYKKKIAPTREGRINADKRKDLHFFFRVRTEVDQEGKIIKAMYGKIYDDIECDFRDFKSKTMGVYFTYYLNPDGTRNIEFNSENLFKEKYRRIWRP